jgi:hypothetical protein
LKNSVGRDDFGADDVVAIDISADKKIVSWRGDRKSPQSQKAEKDESWGFRIHEKRKWMALKTKFRGCDERRIRPT